MTSPSSVTPSATRAARPENQRRQSHFVTTDYGPEPIVFQSHTRQNDAKGQRLKITGNWKLTRELDKDARVWVHLPDHGAQTKLAKYEVKTRNGWRSKTVSQPGDSIRWVKLGIYRTKGIVPRSGSPPSPRTVPGTRTSPSTPWRSSPATGTSFPT